MAVDTFTMKDGRKVKVDFADLKSVLSVKKKDMKEIKMQLDDCIKRVSRRMTGDEAQRHFRNA